MFHIIFIKIEIGNILYECNDFICNVTLYHGLNRLFDTKKLVRQFHGALSTSWDESIARNFAGSAGMILQISKAINNQNVNAIEVDWISCHHMEKEVLLMNPKVMIQKSTIFSNNIELKSSYLKSILLSTINEDDDAFNNLSAFFQSKWITSCLEDTIKDKEFIERMKLFKAKECLNGMSLFELIFFEGQHYQIAKYV
eukprot:471978_1